MRGPTRLSVVHGGWGSERAHRQWPTIDPTRLDDVALLDLWRDERLGAMELGEAAEEWLRTVTAHAERN